MKFTGLFLIVLALNIFNFQNAKLVSQQISPLVGEWKLVISKIVGLKKR